MRKTKILLGGPLLALALAMGCGSEERVVRRTTTIQEPAPAPTPVVRTRIHRTVEESVVE